MKKLAVGLATLVAMAVVPAAADEPGPGGTKPPVARTGADVYRMYCQACHMADAKGAVGAAAFPALADNPRMGTTAYAIYVIQEGKAGMPPFKAMLSREQTAAVVAYLRTHFGNSYPEPVTAADVP
ncbi:cytochrome c [Phenylobacterium sp.]|uniref:c-type cytochrome n=1 Tax=Phenylobacterium sp. TaxID=1871053 RepID=UPI00301BDFED